MTDNSLTNQDFRDKNVFGFMNNDISALGLAGKRLIRLIVMIVLYILILVAVTLIGRLTTEALPIIQSNRAAYLMANAIVVIILSSASLSAATAGYHLWPIGNPVDRYVKTNKTKLEAYTKALLVDRHHSGNIDIQKFNSTSVECDPHAIRLTAHYSANNQDHAIDIVLYLDTNNTNQPRMRVRSIQPVA